MLTIQYDGFLFQGFQIQKNERTVQEELNKALNKLTSENIRIVSAGRTDAGVHANCQVVNFLTTTKIRADKFYFHLLKFLPDDILAINSQEVSLYFHSRFSAKIKTYHYKISMKKILHPIYRNYMENITYPLDFDRLKEAMEILKGEHDFKAFMLEEKNDTINTNRVLDDAYYFIDKDVLTLVFKAESFLHNQVRIMSGTLIEYARGKLTKEDLLSFFDPKNSKKAGPTLKAGGLYLERIEY
ncbi:MAG: tRNA pseudouridine(38-40) synthase TruA [Tissierellia bacterium]|nr:tRNA pseudouridine(38-40) synthase TruA [Tissierellia bacterium]